LYNPRPGAFMFWFRLLFPDHHRTFPGKRWLNISLRSCHILFSSGYAGGVFFDLPFEQLKIFFLLTALTGLSMMLLDFFSNGILIIQNRGWLIVLKLLLLGSLHWFEPWHKIGLVIVILLSGVVSHATGNFRYYSIYHRRRIDLL